MVENTAAQNEAGLKTAGQRRINVIWEVTQAIIALLVSGSTLWVAASLSIRGGADMVTFGLLSNAFFLVIGFYFGRTNHSRQGGVGGDRMREDR